MSDFDIFIVGLFVSLIWGSMIGSMIYAANSQREEEAKQTTNENIVLNKVSNY